MRLGTRIMTFSLFIVLLTIFGLSYPGYRVPIIVIAVLLAYLFSKTVSRPIILLRDSADLMSRGFLGEPVKLRRNDEIGELARSLDNMRYSLKTIIEEYEEIQDKNKPKKRTKWKKA